MTDYTGIDSFDICMSAVALGLISDLDREALWQGCNLAESAEDFDVAILAACRLQEIVTEHNRGKRV